MVLSLVAIGSTPAVAQADGEINVVLEPTAQDVQPGEETTYDVNVEGADDGVSAYGVTVDIGDTSVGTITDGTLVEFGGQFGSVTVSDDGSSVRFEEAVGGDDAGSEDFTLATVTVTAADATGNTELSVSDATVDGNNNSYTNAELGSADLTIPAETDTPDLTGNGEPPQDLNGDGFKEDINGDGEFNIFDIQALFDLLSSSR
jgi:hypothetical protein